MTTHALETAVTLAARARLLAHAPFIALLGTDVGRDSTQGAAYAAETYDDGWVFIGLTQDGRPVRDPTGTGTSAVTLDMYGPPWAPPNNYNTAEYPVLRAIVWSDPTRPTDESGLVAVHDAEDRCMRVRKVIKDLFHDAINDNHVWDDVPIISCVLGSLLPIVDVPPYDGLVKGELRFHLEA